MSQRLNTLARVGLANAIVPTYSNEPARKQTHSINKLLSELETETEKFFGMYDPLTLHDAERINRKIDSVKEKTSLGKPRSIITFIDVAIAVMDEPYRKCKFDRKLSAMRILDTLLMLRKEIGGDRDYRMSSIAASKVDDVWESIDI